MEEFKRFINLKKRLRQLAEQNLENRYVKIGDFTYGNPRILSWDEGSYLSIGKFCSIADDVTILMGGEHRGDWNTTYPFNALLDDFAYIEGHPKTKGDINIGNDVWIAHGSKILSGVNIGDGSIIGANSLVGSDVKPYHIVVGNPIRHIKMRYSKRDVNKLMLMQWWNWDEEDIFKMIPILQSNDIKSLWNYFNNEIKCRYCINNRNATPPKI